MFALRTVLSLAACARVAQGLRPMGSMLAPAATGRAVGSPAAVGGRRRGGRSLTAPSMGAKVPWKTVFLCEYGGPIVIFPLVARGGAGVRSVEVATGLWVLHFAKRFLETLFVHSFSKSTMPLGNLFKNCGYYWTAAALVALDVSRRGAVRVSPTAVGCWFAAEALNGYTHLHLASLRSDGSREAKVPTAWPFKFVCSPNYTFEILSWVAFTAALRSPAAAAFTLVGAAQMALWSRGKLKRYKRKFSADPAFTATHALLPGVF